ncbi:Asp_protease_2 domain-containing protein [Cephalotus follicularis]|uniref:Asp_protease_2 domain-containing protein n=1 Tax=Cephalotus follicularis TaxID=3775 RepID=A0A1Q3B2Y2_CEPFO|nr:Asp_protease_2 domain-containing protein [Cephalotus follicularis]
MGVGALRFLNALNRQLEKKKSHGGGLMYFNIEINGKTSQAMVDTGATHNFVNVKDARRTGMCLTKDTERLKAINSKPLATKRLAKDVLLRLGPWGGQVNSTVAPMDNFDMVLGLEFLTQAKVIPIPATNCLLIMGDCPCVVLASTQPLHKKKFLLAIQFKKGVKRSDPTYVIMPVMSEDVEQKPIPLSIQQLLISYKDIMPNKLPESLPPRRSIDHEIELLPGVKPRAKAPYQMALPELAGL